MGRKRQHKPHCSKCETERILLKNDRYIYPKQINKHNVLSDTKWNYMNQSKPSYYTNHLNKEMFENACKKLFEKSKESNKFVMYTSELNRIELDCQVWLSLNKKHKHAKYILNLFDKLRYVRKVIQFIKLKKHHIEIGYSLMGKERYNSKINKWLDLEENYINRIKKEYYE